MPTIRFGNNSTDNCPNRVYDCLLYQAEPDTAHPSSYIEVGCGSSSNSINRSLIKFNIKETLDNLGVISISSAKLYLYPYNIAGTHTVSVYRVFKNWLDTQATWNSYQTGVTWSGAGCSAANDSGTDDGDYDRKFTAEDSDSSISTGSYSIILDVTDLANKWFNGTAKEYGVLIKSNNENTNNYITAYESSQTDSLRPYLEVSFASDNPVVFGYYDNLLNTGTGWSGFNLRIVINSSLIHTSASIIKLWLSRSNGTTWKFTDCFIGKQASSGDPYDFDGTPVRVTFNGNNGATVTSNNFESDFINFNVDSSDTIVISFYFDDASYDDLPRTADGAVSGIQCYHKYSSNEASVVDVSGYTSQPAGRLFCVSAIFAGFRGKFEGHVYKESTATPYANKKVYCYRRDSGELVSSTTSSGDGYYYLSTTYSGEHFIIAVDDNNVYNLARLDRMIPVTISG